MFEQKPANGKATNDLCISGTLTKLSNTVKTDFASSRHISTRKALSYMGSRTVMRKLKNGMTNYSGSYI